MVVIVVFNTYITTTVITTIIILFDQFIDIVLDCLVSGINIVKVIGP